MGGHAFSSLLPPLYTPRMPQVIYEKVRDETHHVLRQYYDAVATPIEAPAKTDYGDIDILVAGPKPLQYDFLSTDDGQPVHHLATTLRAKAWVQEKGNATVHFAIHWPSSTDGSNKYESLDDREKYIQVDVHLCRSQKQFNWELFHHAHGDIWNILGSIIRRFGLTANDQGLYLRIPEIELHDKKKSMIFLTDEPSKVLHFLGLDEARWWHQFRSPNEMYTFAAECRMFWVKEAIEEQEIEDSRGQALSSYDGKVIDGQEGGESGKKKLKHNDRQRMAKRPLFRQWIEDFIPKCREQNLYTSKTISRDDIRQDAFDVFDAQEEYEKRLKEWRLLKHNEEVFREAIKERVPLEDPVLRGASVKMLKEIVIEGKEVHAAIPPAPARNEDGFFDLQAVERFVDEHWEEAGKYRLERAKAKENIL